MNTPMALNKIYHKNKDFWTPPQTNTMTKLGEYLRASFPTANLSDNTESLKEFDIFVLLPGKNFVISDLLNFCEPKNPVGLIVDEKYKAEVSVWQRNIKSDKIFLSNLFFISDLKNMIGLIASAFYSNPSKKLNITFDKKYKNSGFSLIYNDDLKIKKIDQRSLTIFHKNLKRKSNVKITNPLNGKSLIAEVKSNRVKFSPFYNSIITQRIAEELELDLNEPYIDIVLISKNSTYIAKKTKTFEEEKTVAEKAPIDGIKISDLNVWSTFDHFL